MSNYSTSTAVLNIGSSQLLFDELAKITDISSMAEFHYKKGELILKQGIPATYAVYIQKGTVKVCKENSNGKVNIITLCEAGRFPGILAIIGKGVNEFTLEALSGVTVLNINLDALRAVLLNCPELAMHILETAGRQATDAITRLATINNKQLPGRLADILLYFYRFFGEEMEFELPLKRHELAQFAGTTKESIIRTLAEFKHDKIIELNGSQVRINSMEIVETLSRLG